MSGRSRSCYRWPEQNNSIRSRRSQYFVRSRFTRAHSLESDLSYAARYLLKHNSYRTVCFFEAMDLYRTFDVKFNPMDSSHFESNFKRTINYPTTRTNMNGPSKRMTYWRYSGDSRIKKVGGTPRPRKKVVVQHKCLSCMVIFHCNKDWFAIIKPIKPNVGLWTSSERSPESLQIV